MAAPATAPRAWGRRLQHLLGASLLPESRSGRGQAGGAPALVLVPNSRLSAFANGLVRWQIAQRRHECPLLVLTAFDVLVVALVCHEERAMRRPRAAA